MKSASAGADAAAGCTLLPAVPERRMQAEVDEEETWLKRTVSLPSLPRGPRPLLWQRAEGTSSPAMESDLRRSKSDLSAQPNALRSSSGKWNLNPEEALSRDAEQGAGAKCSGSSGYPEKRKRDKKIDLVARECAHVDKHRQLKQMLREERQVSGSLSSCKRLVGGLVTSKDTPWRRKLIDQQKTEKSIKRIEGHLHGCSHARHELVAMQRKMALLSDPPTTFCSDLHHIFADTLKRTHSQDGY